MSFDVTWSISARCIILLAPFVHCQCCHVRYCASVRLSLRVLKAKYLQKKGYLREQHGKLQKMRTAISQKEQELDEKNEERSSSFSSGSPLVPPSDSDSESGDSCGMESGARFSVSLWSLCFVEQSFVCRPRIAAPT